MAKLFLMVGVPGAGKSTYIKNNAGKYSSAYGIISRDAIRFKMLSEEDEYFAKENEVYAEFIRQINEFLSDDIDVFVDATHITKGSRKKLLDAVSARYEEVNAIWVDLPLNTILTQNAQREGRALVPTSVVRRMFYQFEEPTEKEGFKHIYKIKREEE